MATSVIGALRVTLAMNAGVFTKGAKGAMGTVANLDRAFKRVAGAAAGMTIAATAAAAALATKMTRASLATIDAQAKLARRVGGTVTAIQALERAGDLAGLSGGMLAKAAEKLNERLGEAERRGIGPAAEALDRLGLSASALIGLDVDERLAVIADKFQELGLSAAAQSDVLRDFGIRNKELINLFEGGGAAIRAARTEIQSFGIAVSDVDARKIEAANDAMTKIGLTFTAIGNRLAVELSPFITAIADQFGEAAKESHGFSGAIADAIGWAVKGLGMFLDEVKRSRIDWDILVGAILDGANAIIRKTNDITQKYTSAWIPAIKEIKHDYGKLQEKLGERMPSEGLDEWVADVKQRAQEAAEALAKATPGAGGGGGGTDNTLTERQIAERDAQRAHNESKLEQMRLSLLTERELELESYQTRLEDLALFEEQKLLTAAEANDLRARAESDHLDRIASLNRDNASRVARVYTDMGNRIGNTISALSNVIGGESDKQFGILKAASIATALLKAYESITSSYAAGAAIGGPPVGTAYAAIAAATTAAQIAALAGVGSGSSGSPSAARGGGGSAEAAAAAAPQQGVSQTLQVTGLSKDQFLDGETVRSFAEQLVEYQRDGGTVVFAA